MGNPFYKAINGGPQGGSVNVMQQFQQFMMQNRGKDPNEVLQQMLTSGQISQEHLNQAQQMKRQVEGPLNGLKSMFGFH